MEKKKVGIVLINWNGIQHTRACLVSLQAISYSKQHIVVVDNGSANREDLEISREFPSIHMVRNDENKGFAAANNQGIEWALGINCELVLLLNNDTVVTPDFLEPLVADMDAYPEAAAASSLITYFPQTDTLWFAGGRLLYPFGIYKHTGKKLPTASVVAKLSHEVDFLTGCCLLMRSTAIREIGPLQEDYFAYYEDTDWCLRARQSGSTVRMVPTSVIGHQKSASAGEAGKDSLSKLQAYLWARNSLRFARLLKGYRAILFVLGLFSFRLFYSLCLCRGQAARISYLKGMFDGVTQKDKFYAEHIH